MQFLEQRIVQEVDKRAIFIDEHAELMPLIDQISRAKVVFLGESSHGTREFYEWRSLISEWLIREHGYRFIAVEGDYPPAAQVNQYIRRPDEAPDSIAEVLKAFDRWPTWMWANTEVIRLASMLRDYNASVSAEQQAGFFGLDVYSLFESIDAVIGELEAIDPLLAKRARHRYSCFDLYQRNEKDYAKSLIAYPDGCTRQVVEVLRDLLNLRLTAETEHAGFDIQQNARVVANAEDYYRTMIRGDDDSWNVRDRHMMETLENILDFYGPGSKGIVWAHNTHIGDYRATDMLHYGQINIGGLARQRWGDDKVALVGFGTYEGEVIASHAWDGPIERMVVPPARPDSYDAYFHAVARAHEKNCFYLPLIDSEAQAGLLSETHGQRAIGVVYNPRLEQLRNYVPTSLSYRYDAFMFFDRSTSIEPLKQPFGREHIPETWPGNM